MKPLSLLFLGSPVVVVAEAPKIELSKKTIVLLGYLESRPGMHRREKIAEWLWGGSDEACQNLRQCLFHLPKSLKEYGFEVTLDEIGLPLSRYSSDLKRFDDALRKANALSVPNERIELLKLALQIPRGEFLEGIAAKGVYRHWLAQEREKWNTKHALALTELAKSLCETQDLSGAVEHAQKAHTLCPKLPFVRETWAYLQTAETNHAALFSPIRPFSLHRTPSLQLQKERISSLPPEVGEALRVLSLFPGHFSATQARAVCGVSAVVLDCLQHEGFITEDEGGHKVESECRAWCQSEMRDSDTQIFHRKLKAWCIEFVRGISPLPIKEKLVLCERGKDSLQVVCEQIILGSDYSEEHLSYLYLISPILDDKALQSALDWFKAGLNTNPDEEHEEMLRDYAGSLATALKQWREASDLLRPMSDRRAESLDRTLDIVNRLAVAMHHAEEREAARALVQQWGKTILEKAERGKHVSLLCQFTEMCLTSKDYVAALQFSVEAVSQARLIVSPQQRQIVLAPALYQQGNALRRNGQEGFALTSWDEACHYFRFQEDKHGEADCLQRIAEVRLAQGMTAESLFLAEKALSFYKALTNEGSCAACLGTLGDIYAAQCDYERATQLYKEGLEYWEGREHRTWIAAFERKIERIKEQ